MTVVNWVRITAALYTYQALADCGKVRNSLNKSQPRVMILPTQTMHCFKGNPSNLPPKNCIQFVSPPELVGSHLKDPCLPGGFQDFFSPKKTWQLSGLHAAKETKGVNPSPWRLAQRGLGGAEIPPKKIPHRFGCKQMFTKKNCW